MKIPRRLSLGLPLLLSVVAVAYCALQPDPAEPAGLPIGPPFPASEGALVGPPIQLADGTVYLLVREMGSSDSPQALFTTQPGSSGRTRVPYWDWIMDCPGFYFVERLAGQHANTLLVKAHCHDTKRAGVDFLDPSHAAITPVGSFDVVARGVTASDGTTVLLAQPPKDRCLSVVGTADGPWRYLAEGTEPDALASGQDRCRFAGSAFLGVDGQHRVYLVQGRTMLVVDDRGDVAESKLPFETVWGMAVAEDGRVAVTGRSQGRTGLWLFDPGSRTAHLQAAGTFTELSWSVDGAHVLTGQLIRDETHIVRIPVG